MSPAKPSAPLGSARTCSTPTFSDHGPGGARELKIHELLRLRRIAVPKEVSGSAPPELVHYLGTYHLAKVQTDFKVVYHQGTLALRQPGVDRPIRLDPANEDGRWVDEFGRRFRFSADETGAIVELSMEVISLFERTGTAGSA